MIINSNPNKFAGVVVVNNSARYKFLTLHFRNPKPWASSWRIPGGKPEPGELMIVAAARELFQETGLVARHLQFVEIHNRTYGDVVWEGHIYLCREFEGLATIKEPDKHDQIDWLTVQGLTVRGAHHEVDLCLRAIQK